ncbi:sensor domain-containing diguanylate cyclase [Thiocystis violascens]|uniref:diguanylate cyclase n=1 Tax=Thiocystis violascens (strain ATCC 17096 / DSM 198 / 6111) TaxID=765911 RepID=I3YH33_THIV6|nr:HDOD domain-containing protein [Thiocystis violascens]AFL76301.1 diguanylate cyclase (GGDEF) domain/uncharacterized domain HDIG-containing protein [Thiocystis violascens DSM 198]
MDDPDRNAQAVRAALRGEVSELLPAPAAAVKLLQLTRDEDAGVGAISHVIETEPALAAKVLRIVNSAFYGFPRHIRSIHRAVTLLGLSAVRQAALHLLFYEGLIQRGDKGVFDRLYFWQHSLLVAILSRDMAERLEHPDPDSLYAAGLLHDLGKMILESHGRVRYSDFLAASSNSGNPVREDEQTYFGVSHDTVGAVIGERWQLPELICRVQRLHHSSFSDAGLTPLQAQEVAIVVLADFIAWTQGIGSTNTRGSPALSPDVVTLVPLERIDLPDILERADKEISEIGAFYGLQFPSSQQLRANLVSTVIGLSRADSGHRAPMPAGSRASYTAPHHSLDPDEFIPRTLEALQREFGIRRLLMMQIEPKRRSLVATHALPAPMSSNPRPPLELAILTLSGDLVRCLREHRPTLIRESPENAEILASLEASEAAVVPVMNHGRLLGVLCLSNGRDEAPVGIGPLAEVMRVASELGIALERSRIFAQERAKAEIDPLTRLHNRSAMERFLNQSFRQAAESGRRFAVGLLDIDRFKVFNDSFGHQAGDDVLRIVADTMRSLTRPGDFLGRYGGEEFLFVLLDASEQTALVYAERIRKEIERRGQMLQERFPGHALTASVGVAINDSRYPGPREIVAAADAALYRAKETGRNRVVPAWRLSNAS